MLTNSQCIAILVWGISRTSPPDYSSASKAFEFLTSRAPLTSGVCPLCHQPHGTSYWVSRLFFKRRISFMESENGISTLTSNLLPVDNLAESRFINFSHLDHFLLAVQNAQGASLSSRYPGKKPFFLRRYYIKGSMDEETIQSRTFSRERDSPHFLYVRDTSSRLEPRYHQQACRGSSITSRSSLKGCEDCLVCHRLQEPWLGCWVLLTTVKLLRRKSSSYEINRSAYISRYVGAISLETALK